MYVTTDMFGWKYLNAEVGMSISNVEGQTENEIIAVQLVDGDVPENYHDCALVDNSIANEDDKDAALSALGVDMTEGDAQ